MKQIPHFRVLSVIAFATFLSGLAWLLVLIKLDPYETIDLAISLFFLSFFFFLTGIFCLMLFFIRAFKKDHNVLVKDIFISLRQGMLLSLCTCLCLALLMLGLLRIWNGFLLVSIVTLLEFYLSQGEDR